jgi:hypothetical protein
MHKEICEFVFKEVKIKVQLSVAIHASKSSNILDLLYKYIKVIPLKFNLGPDGNHKWNGLIYVSHPTNKNLLKLLSNFF